MTTSCLRPFIEHKFEAEFPKYKCPLTFSKPNPICQPRHACSATKVEFAPYYGLGVGGSASPGEISEKLFLLTLQDAWSPVGFLDPLQLFCWPKETPIRGVRSELGKGLGSWHVLLPLRSSPSCSWSVLLPALICSIPSQSIPAPSPSQYHCQCRVYQLLHHQ